MAFDKKYLSIIMKRVFESQNSSEQIELISDDDQRIPIHRVILTAASKYFEASLGPNWNFLKRDRNEGKELEGADGETLRMIVDYCYTGNINLTEENVQTFLTIASRYQFDLLEEKCCSFYAGILSVTNSVEALMIAEELSYAGLRQAALDLIFENFESVPTAEVQKLDHQLFEEILESDKITSSEQLILDRLLKWSEHEEHKPFVPNLLKLIRLQHIELEILRDTFEAIYQRFNCTELMHAEYRRRSSDNYFDSGIHRCRSIFYLWNRKSCIESGKTVFDVNKLKRESRSWENIAKFDLGKRTDYTMVLYQNKIYALGGLLNRAYCNNVSSFDLNSREEEILPKMNISRADCTSIAFGKYIYVFGGWNDSGRLSSCERFDTKAKTWTKIKSMNKARSSASAVVMNGCIYIANGTVDASTFESYDPTRNVWKELAPMNISRVNFPLIQSNGFIYAFGGGAKDTIEKYDPSENQWTKISRPAKSRYIQSGFNVNGEIYVMSSYGELRRIKINESDKCSWVVEKKRMYVSGGIRFLVHD